MTMVEFRHMARIGRSFRLVSALRWECETLRHPDSQRATNAMARYSTTIAGIVDEVLRS
jgi:hypothetical protein